MSNSWRGSGGSLASYRRGSSLARLGPFLLSLGGHRKSRSYRSVEVLDSRRPERGWRKSASLALPVGVSEHCSVVLAGNQGREVIVTGGRGRGDR